MRNPLDHRWSVVVEMRNDGNEFDALGDTVLISTDQTMLITIPSAGVAAGDLRFRLQGGNDDTDLTPNIS